MHERYYSPMLYEVPPLISLHAFESTARHGSFAAAAKELNITQSAVSHRIRHLENHLGYSLFDRSPRSLHLNDMGKAYLPSVRLAFNEISSSTSAIFGSAKRKTVTIRVPVTHAVLWLAPRREPRGCVPMGIYLSPGKWRQAPLKRISCTNSRCQ